MREFARSVFNKAFFIAFLVGCGVLVMGSGFDKMPKELMQNFHAEALLKAIMSDGFIMVLPIMAALPYTSAYVDDMRTGYYKLYMIRTRRAKYAINKVVCAGVSGGLVVALSIVAVYVVYVLVFGPMEQAVKGSLPMTSKILEKALLSFFVGMFFSVVGATLAAVTLSKYMAYASPFIMYYLLIILHERYFKTCFIIYPKEWLEMKAIWPVAEWGIVIFLLEITFVTALGFYMIVQRRLNA